MCGENSQFEGGRYGQVPSVAAFSLPLSQMMRNISLTGITPLNVIPCKFRRCCHLVPFEEPCTLDVDSARPVSLLQTDFEFMLRLPPRKKLGLYVSNSSNALHEKNVYIKIVLFISQIVFRID